MSFATLCFVPDSDMESSRDRDEAHWTPGPDRDRLSNFREGQSAIDKASWTFPQFVNSRLAKCLCLRVHINTAIPLVDVPTGVIEHDMIDAEDLERNVSVEIESLLCEVENSDPPFDRVIELWHG